MSDRGDDVGVRGDGGGDTDGPLVGPFSGCENTCIMECESGETNSGLNRHRIDPGGK
jgi:hypothetical protein